MASTSSGQDTSGNPNNSQTAAKDTKQYTERVVKSVQYPVSDRLNVEQVFDRRTGKPRHDVLRDYFIKEGRIEEDAAIRIIQECTALFRQEKLC
nr:serine/threonine-protein phosphatase 2B [Haemonchus contortus]